MGDIFRVWNGEGTHIDDIEVKDILSFLTIETGATVPVSREEFEDLKTVMLAIFWRFSTINPHIKIEIESDL